MYITNVNELVAALRPRLEDYLVNQLGEDARANGKSFNCFAHDDDNPSMSYNPKNGNQTVRCWSNCGSYDIFSACSVLEGMPANGAEWVTETLPHLAEALDIKVQLGEPTEEDRTRLKLRKLCQDIATILTNSQGHKSYIQLRGWSDEKLTIGTVSTEELIAELVEMGWTPNDILTSMVIQTATRQFFGEDKVTFVINDYRGRPVGFISRNLASEKPKYINTLETPIYKKGEALLGLDIATAEAKTKGLIIVEGPGDLASLHRVGIYNAAAICGTSFTASHLALLKMLGIRKVFFCLDWDGPGVAATQRIFKEELKFAPGVSCSVILGPEDETIGDISDLLAKEQNSKKFDELERIRAFEFSLNFISDNQTPESVCEDIIPIIASEESAVRRENLIGQLSEFTRISFQSISQDVTNIRDKKAQEKQERVEAAIEKYYRSASNDPENILSHISQHEEDLERIDKHFKNQEIGVNYQLNRYDAIQEQKLEVHDDNNMAEFIFIHHDMFRDALSGGMNVTSGILIYVGGRANSGKTTVVSSWGIDVSLHDPMARVVMHYTDDSYTQIEPRLLTEIAVMLAEPGDAILSIGMAANPKHNIRTEAQWSVYHRANNMLRKLIETERLVLIDAEDGSNLTALERNLQYIRRKYPSDKLLVVADKPNCPALG